jgi:hypothetical protein
MIIIFSLWKPYSRVHDRSVSFFLRWVMEFGLLFQQLKKKHIDSDFLNTQKNCHNNLFFLQSQQRLASEVSWIMMVRCILNRILLGKKDMSLFVEKKVWIFIHFLFCPTNLALGFSISRQPKNSFFFNVNFRFLLFLKPKMFDPVLQIVDYTVHKTQFFFSSCICYLSVAKFSPQAVHWT